MTSQTLAERGGHTAAVTSPTGQQTAGCYCIALARVSVVNNKKLMSYTLLV